MSQQSAAQRWKSEPYPAGFFLKIAGFSMQSPLFDDFAEEISRLRMTVFEVDRLLTHAPDPLIKDNYWCGIRWLDGEMPCHVVCYIHEFWGKTPGERSQQNAAMHALLKKWILQVLAYYSSDLWC